MRGFTVISKEDHDDPESEKDEEHDDEDHKLIQLSESVELPSNMITNRARTPPNVSP